nr:transposase [Burkholderia ambifaria]
MPPLWQANSFKKRNNMTPSMSSLASTSGKDHTVALDRNGKRLYNKVLPTGGVKLRALIAELNTPGRSLFVVDQTSTIGALPVAVARAEGVLVAICTDWP